MVPPGSAAAEDSPAAASLVSKSYQLSDTGPGQTHNPVSWFENTRWVGDEFLSCPTPRARIEP